MQKNKSLVFFPCHFQTSRIIFFVSFYIFESCEMSDKKRKNDFSLDVFLMVYRYQDNSGFCQPDVSRGPLQLNVRWSSFTAEQ